MSVTRTRSTAQATAEGLRVFVAGVAWNITEDVLQRDFGECGVIEDLFLIKDSEGNSKGRCFITFRDKDAVDAALEYNNTDYGGRKIFVKVAEAKRDSPQDASQSTGKKPVGCTSLCLKRIGDASEDSVSDFLSGCSVQAIRLLTDRETGSRRGVAFVDFNTTEDVDKAMKLNRKNLNGSAVEMDYVIPKGGAPKQDKPSNFPTEKPDGCTTICLKNLGDAVEDDIWKFLDECDVQSIRVVYDRVSGASRGIAFADFSSTSGVDKAMLRNGKNLKGKSVEMKYEAPKDRPRPEGCLTVAVKKLPASALETDVRKLFKGLRSICDVRVICDKMMACTGLAFVEFTEPADVEAAVKRDGMSVLGQTVFICYETKHKAERKSPIMKHAEEPAVGKKAKDNAEQAFTVEHADGTATRKRMKKEPIVDVESSLLGSVSQKAQSKLKRKDNEKRLVAEKERKKLRKKKKRKEVGIGSIDMAQECQPPSNDDDIATSRKTKKKRGHIGEPQATKAAADDLPKVRKEKKRKVATD